MPINERGEFIRPEKAEQEHKPEPAESFEIEFLSANLAEREKALSDLGFRYRGGGPVGEGKVRYFGERVNGDGTQIEVIITKGKDYKTPKELAEQEEEKKNK